VKSIVSHHKRATNNKCEKIHDLIWKNDYKNEIIEKNCDLCRKELIGANKGHFKCSKGCNYDICERCGLIPETSHTCENGNLLVYSDHLKLKKGSNRLRCVICYSSIYPEDKMWAC
jgi:hypothetical protein